VLLDQDGYPLPITDAEFDALSPAAKRARYVAFMAASGRWTQGHQQAQGERTESAASSTDGSEPSALETI
jgi:hypothetical protein